MGDDHVVLPRAERRRRRSEGVRVEELHLARRPAAELDAGALAEEVAVDHHGAGRALGLPVGLQPVHARHLAGGVVAGEGDFPVAVAGLEGGRDALVAVGLVVGLKGGGVIAGGREVGVVVGHAADPLAGGRIGVLQPAAGQDAERHGVRHLPFAGQHQRAHEATGLGVEGAVRFAEGVARLGGAGIPLQAVVLAGHGADHRRPAPELAGLQPAHLGGLGQSQADRAAVHGDVGDGRSVGGIEGAAAQGGLDGELVHAGQAHCQPGEADVGAGVCIVGGIAPEERPAGIGTRGEELIPEPVAQDGVPFVADLDAGETFQRQDARGLAGRRVRLDDQSAGAVVEIGMKGITHPAQVLLWRLSGAVWVAPGHEQADQVRRPPRLPDEVAPGLLDPGEGEGLGMGGADGPGGN